MKAKGVPDILQRILHQKAKEVVARAEETPLREMSRLAEKAPAVRPFAESLEARIQMGAAAVIAEAKRASPSKGILRDPFDPTAIAKSYADADASALSILTDEVFFQGRDEYLGQARAASGLPVLRKDFVIEQYQVYEARALGADCILLIVAALGDALLAELFGLAHHLRMDALVEVHNADEMKRALELQPRLLGINNRDLRTFNTSLDTTLQLLPGLPGNTTVITESGILTPIDVALMRENGVHGFLVGEAFMRADDPGAKLKELFAFRN